MKQKTTIGTLQGIIKNLEEIKVLLDSKNFDINNAKELSVKIQKFDDELQKAKRVDEKLKEISDSNFNKIFDIRKKIVNVDDNIKQQGVEEFKTILPQLQEDVKMALDKYKLEMGENAQKDLDKNFSKIYDEVIKHIGKPDDNKQKNNVTDVLQKHFDKMFGEGLFTTEEYEEVAAKIFDNLSSRKGSITSVLDILKKFLDENLGTNLLLGTDKSQKDLAKSEMTQGIMGKFTQKVVSDSGQTTGRGA